MLLYTRRYILLLLLLLSFSPVVCWCRSWSLAFPDIVVSCPIYAAKQQTPINIPTLHPLRNITKQVVKQVITQLATVFTSSPYFHVGGDEVAVDCWKEDAALVAYAAEKKITLTEVRHCMQCVMSSL